MTNFVIVYLCDNDFGDLIRQALLDPPFELDKMDQDLWHRHIVSFIVGKHIARRCESPINFDRAKGVENYLNNKLKIELSYLKPSIIDHDGGSAALDINRNYAWTF